MTITLRQVLEEMAEPETTARDRWLLLSIILDRFAETLKIDMEEDMESICQTDTVEDAGRSIINSCIEESRRRRGQC